MTDLPTPSDTQPVTKPQSSESATTETVLPETTEPLLPDNPVDFSSLQEINPDLYAWLYVPLSPDCKDIDLPVAQSRPTDAENFYLHRDIYRKYLFSGTIYTQKINSKDFSDRVTILYGHNMLNGSMFAPLANLRYQKIFNEHEFFYIYTPGHVLTYRIAAAIQFDKRHILNCFDFSDDEVYADWIRNYILEPKVMVRNYRKDLEITIEDRLVILSTCLEHGASRYLVEGVLISDVHTK
jgi:sortase B